jgi:acyl-CoA thioester hydrolase
MAVRTRREVPADPRDLGGDFSHTHLVEVRLADTDAMGHVNNAFYLTYVEIARVAYYEQVIGEPLPLGVHGAEEGMILAEIRVTYRSQAFYGETLAIESRIERIGRSSFSMAHRLTAPASRFGGARLIAVADSVLVSYDYREDRPIPVPGAWRTRIEAFEGRSFGAPR